MTNNRAQRGKDAKKKGSRSLNENILPSFAPSRLCVSLYFVQELCRD
jgi:hypothetical protein